MDEIPIVKDDGDGKKNNAAVGLCAVIVIAALIPVTVIAIPLIAALYKWAFGG